MLKQMQARMPADDKGFGKTHPDPQDRIKDIAVQLEGVAAVKEQTARQKRFKKAMKGV